MSGSLVSATKRGEGGKGDKEERFSLAPFCPFCNPKGPPIGGVLDTSKTPNIALEQLRSKTRVVHIRL